VEYGLKYKEMGKYNKATESNLIKKVDFNGKIKYIRKPIQGIRMFIKFNVSKYYAQASKY